MASLLGKVARLTRTPQGQKMMREAQRLARDPNTRRKIDEARARLSKRKSA